MICPHCHHRFGYLIDGVFYPVAWHIHKMPDGTKRKFVAAALKETGDE